MIPSKSPNRYVTSRQLIGGDDFNNVVDQLNSNAVDIVAQADTTKANATQLNAHVNTVATVAGAADSLKLPKGFPGLEVWIINSGANAAQVFGYGSDTINSIDTATGVSQAAGATTIYKCNSMDAVTKIANWISK